MFKCNAQMFIIIMLVVAFFSTAAAQEHLAQFPVLAPGQTEYVIPVDQANGLIIDTLYIPKNVTLRAGEGVQSINWSVGTIKVEEGATFDLSAPQIKPLKAADGAPPPKQASYCAPGAAGASGSNGSRGAMGVNLVLRDVVSIDNQGSLWIRTDGGPGGDGGNGGKGQQGGGPRKNVLNKKCGAGPGGPGGLGGAGGEGGATSRVVINFKGNSGESGIPNGVSSTCGPSHRPSAAQGKNGVTVIWGGAGCPGSSGAVGPAGIGG